MFRKLTFVSDIDKKIYFVPRGLYTSLFLNSRILCLEENVNLFRVILSI